MKEGRTVGIVGLGLIGGSLARGLRTSGTGSVDPTRRDAGGGSDDVRIVASSLDRSELDRALDEGIVDRACDDSGEVAAEADLLVYATPLDATLRLLEGHRERLGTGAVVTDVVSLKVPVQNKIRDLGLEEQWVGGHPMAGSEQSGFEASRPDLFRDAPIYLVRGDASTYAIERVQELWERVDGLPRWVEAEAHDRLMIWASHLPQLVSNALAASLERAGVSPSELGPGGRDMTRLAASAPDLWKGLLRAGGSRETESLEAVIGELEGLVELLSSGKGDEIEGYMDRTRRWREGEDVEDGPMTGDGRKGRSPREGEGVGPDVGDPGRPGAP